MFCDEWQPLTNPEHALIVGEKLKISFTDFVDRSPEQIAIEKVYAALAHLYYNGTLTDEILKGF